MNAEMPPPATLHERRVHTVIDELLPPQGSNLVHGLIEVEAAASILEAAGAFGAADRLRVVAGRIATERREAFWRAQEESERRSTAARRYMREWTRRVPCPRCGAPAGRACKLPSGARVEESHKDRRDAAGPVPAAPNG